MKTCPHCGGQIRPSVIRCVHCGTPLAGEPAGAPADVTIQTASVATGVPSPATDLPGAGAVGAPPTPRPAPDPWVTPAVRADAQTKLPPVTPPRRPEATRATSRRTDLVLTGAAVLAVAGSVAAYSALPLPWVRAELTTTSERSGVTVVADMIFRGSDSVAGTVGLGVAVTLLALGILWFWYSLDRGLTMPTFAHPLLALLAAVIGAVVLAFCRLGYLFWDDAIVTRAREAGMTKEAMRQLLDSRPAPDIAIEQLTGAYRFGTGVLLALVAGVVAWWSQRRRGWS